MLVGENIAHFLAREHFSLSDTFSQGRVHHFQLIYLYLLREQIFSIVMSKINDQTENYRKRNKEEGNEKYEKLT